MVVYRLRGLSMKTIKISGLFFKFFIFWLASLVSAMVFAQWGPGPYPIHRFHERHYEVWRGGSWFHGNYGGRLGWYWVVGGIYYFYPRPIYPYPDPYMPGVLVTPNSGPMAPPPPSQPPTPMLQGQNLPSVWYFCESSKGYYPYVSECPSGWKTVPASPPQLNN